MKRILQIAATSIALVMVFAVAIPALAASTCTTANVSPINDCLAKYKLAASDISNIAQKLSECGLTEEVLRYGPFCEAGECTTPHCTKEDCDGTACVTTDCAGAVCTNTASDEQLDSCTEADCAVNGCDAADCQTAGCKDTCTDTKCIPAVEETSEKASDNTEAKAAVPSKTENDSQVEAVADTQDETGNAVINEALAEAEEAVKDIASSSNDAQCDVSSQVAGIVSAPQQSASCPTGSSDTGTQIKDAVSKALDQVKSYSNCPTSGSDASAQLQDAVSKALDQVKAQVSSGSNCPTISSSVDVNGILNQLQNSGLNNCNK